MEVAGSMVRVDMSGSAVVGAEVAGGLEGAAGAPNRPEGAPNRDPPAGALDICTFSYGPWVLQMIFSPSYSTL